MQHVGSVRSNFGIERHGVTHARKVHWNLSRSALVEEAIRRGEGTLSADGALVVDTGEHTGRSPKDRFIVDDPSLTHRIHWGKWNHPMSPERFERLHARTLAYLHDRDLFVQDLSLGPPRGEPGPSRAIPIRIVSTSAPHALFARTMFRSPPDADLGLHTPEITLLHAPGFRADPSLDGTSSDAFIVTHHEKRLVLIGGTAYAGEIEKAIFGFLSYLLPVRGILPMHASLNVGQAGDAALFFGMSGTGKTTLSSDPTRTLVGDDEHGWDDRGTYNFEGGCYAKVIKLSKEAEPDIWQACHQYGTLLENVAMDPSTRAVDFDIDARTENTRAAYSLERIPHASETGTAGHPRYVIMLTADAYGVLPPLSRLTPEQAVYHFLSGYTARVAGTEAGLTEPQATFSACFAEPFLALDPVGYATLFGQKLAQHRPAVWLVNTGWTGGPHGVGYRMSLGHTRAMLRAVLSGKLSDARLSPDPVFKTGVPSEVPGVQRELLWPRSAWADKAAYDRQAKELAARFRANFEACATRVPREVALAGPA